jgi:hypothetical protein
LKFRLQALFPQQFSKMARMINLHLSSPLSPNLNNRGQLFRRKLYLRQMIQRTEQVRTLSSYHPFKGIRFSTLECLINLYIQSGYRRDQKIYPNPSSNQSTSPEFDLSVVYCIR